MFWWHLEFFEKKFLNISTVFELWIHLRNKLKISKFRYTPTGKIRQRKFIDINYDFCLNKEDSNYASLHVIFAKMTWPSPTDLTLTLQLRLVQLVDVALDLGVEILATPVQELAPALTQHRQVVLLVRSNVKNERTNVPMERNQNVLVSFPNLSYWKR